MQTAEALRKQIKVARDLHSVVKTMKALAAVKISELQSAVRALAAYNRTVKMGMRVVLKKRPAGVAPGENVKNDLLGVVVFGSDQGMCGQFNEEVTRFAYRELAQLKTPDEPPAVLAVGGRVTARLEEAGLPVQSTFPAPASLGGVSTVVQELLLAIQQWRAERQIERVVLYYNMHVSSAAYRPRSLQMLPLDPQWLKSLEEDTWPTNVLPTFSMQWDKLFASLVREYLSVSLYRAATESQASENAARLASMQAAEKNIEERMKELDAEFHHVRQTAITAELLDIVSGFEALMGEEQ